MARKSKAEKAALAATETTDVAEQPTAEPTPAAEPAPAPAQQSDTTEQNKAAFTERDVPVAGNVQRISIKLTADGKIDFESMRDATAATFKAAIAKSATDPKNLAKLGLAQQQQPVLFPPQFCEQIFDGVGRITGIVYVKVKKVPDVTLQTEKGVVNLPAYISGVFQYTDEEKKQLAPITARVLSKHAPEKIAKYSDEIQLAWTLFSINAGKIDACNRMVDNFTRALMAQQKREKQTEQQAESGVILTMPESEQK